MDQDRVKKLLTDTGAVVHGHFVGTNGNHFSVYVAKDRATRFPSIVSELSVGMAAPFASSGIDAVVAPAVGGIALSQRTAFFLTKFQGDRPEVLALYSEPDDSVVWEGKGSFSCNSFCNSSLSPERTMRLEKGDKLILRRSKFVLKRGFDIDVRGKRVLEVEDVLTTGDSARRTAEAIIEAGGILVGLSVLVNGGNVTPEACGVPRLESLMTMEREVFTEKECAENGLCARGVPISTEFGHGKHFLARKGG